MITEMNRQAARDIKVRVQEALNEVAKDMGLGSLEAASGTYYPLEGSYTFKVTAHVKKVAADGTTVSPARQRWNANAAFVGLKKEWFQKTFDTGSDVFTITDFRPRARKN